MGSTALEENDRLSSSLDIFGKSCKKLLISRLAPKLGLIITMDDVRAVVLNLFHLRHPSLVIEQFTIAPLATIFK